MRPGEEALIANASLFFDVEQYRAVEVGIRRKRPLFAYLFKIVSFLSRFALGNLLLLGWVILGYTVLRSPPRGALFQYGMSGNNVRVFRRLNTSAGRKNWNNIVNGWPITFSTRLLLLLRVRRLWRMACILTKQRSTSSFSHTQLIITGAAWCVYDCEDFNKIKCVCVASDHSPIALALLHVARERSVQTCYVQHAPIASHFPPLNYDLSVLFDRASRNIYAEVAAKRPNMDVGDVVILPPFEENARTPSLPDHPPYRIGLCLSYLFDPVGVEKLVRELLDHPSVESIHLRRHPRCKADLGNLLCNERVSESRADGLAEFARECDIALVPNSGVTIELLHLGKPVMYTPGVDFISNDYYGFVRGGIIPIFDADWMASATRMRNFFDCKWRERYVLFDETIVEPLEVSRERAGAAFRKLVEG